MKFKRFSPVAAIILPMVTFGIFGLIVWISTTNSHNYMAKQTGQKTIMPAFPALLLGCVTFGIFPIIWLVKYARQTVEVANAKGIRLVPGNSTAGIFWIYFVPIYGWIAFCQNHNRLCDAYEAVETTTEEAM